jgi:hypothetical protein
MLAWYHSQSPFLFELYGATRELLRAAESCPADAWRRAAITPQGMALRGQMGRYWSAMPIGAP